MADDFEALRREIVHEFSIPELLNSLQKSMSNALGLKEEYILYKEVTEDIHAKEIDQL